MKHKLDTFTRAYCVAALWTSEPEELATSGDFESKGLSLVDSIKPDWIAKAVADCTKFQLENAALLEQAGTADQNGHDFWLTRNGHGAGFWDRGYLDEIGDALAKASKAFGEAYLDWECDIDHE